MAAAVLVVLLVGSGVLFDLGLTIASLALLAAAALTPPIAFMLLLLRSIRGP